MNEMQKISEATAFLRERGFESPSAGIVLGTGLREIIQHIRIEEEIEYAQIPHFPVATVETHKGKLVYGDLAGTKILVMQGRFHFYEGHSMAQIVLPIRVMKMLGVGRLLLSNVAGGINPAFRKGDLVAIEDHVNLQPSGPLVGQNLDELGPRFPDMSSPYAPELIRLLQRAAVNTGTKLKQGVYAAVTGPQLETRAEYRYLRIIGADMVGMSTVPEVIAARHMNLPCGAVSIITDECDPENLAPINVSEILEIAAAADKILAGIFKAALAKSDTGN